MYLCHLMDLLAKFIRYVLPLFNNGRMVFMMFGSNFQQLTKKLLITFDRAIVGFVGGMNLEYVFEESRLNSELSFFRGFYIAALFSGCGLAVLDFHI